MTSRFALYSVDVNNGVHFVGGFDTDVAAIAHARLIYRGELVRADTPGVMGFTLAPSDTPNTHKYFVHDTKPADAELPLPPPELVESLKGMKYWDVERFPKVEHIYRLKSEYSSESGFAVTVDSSNAINLVHVIRGAHHGVPLEAWRELMADIVDTLLS